MRAELHLEGTFVRGIVITENKADIFFKFYWFNTLIYII